MKAAKSHLGHASGAAALALVLAWPGSASAGHRDPDRMAFGKMIGGKVHFATVWRGNGNWKYPFLIAANTESEWNQAMAEVGADNGFIVKTTGDSQPPAPVEWSRESVVLVALGRSSDSVDVREVRCKRHQLHIYVHLQPGGPVGEVDQSPHQLVAVTRKPIDAVAVHYDWAPPGMPTFVKPGHVATSSQPTAGEIPSPPVGGGSADSLSAPTPGTTNGH